MGINNDKQLLVEGNNDFHVMNALCEKYSVNPNFRIINCGGINKLFELVPSAILNTNINTLGIIIDADLDLNKQWSKLKNILIEKGFKIPNDLPSSGLICKNDDEVKVGVWIMPDNNLNGMLEDFIKFLIPENDPCLVIANATLEKIETQKLNKYAAIHKSKALIHTWLAWQEDPGTPMGLSITKKYLDTDNETSLEFANWLRELFKPEAQ